MATNRNRTSRQQSLPSCRRLWRRKRAPTVRRRPQPERPRGVSSANPRPDTAYRARNATFTILPIWMSARPASTTSGFRRSCQRFRPEFPGAIDPIPDTSIVEQEREQFLKQFKSQLLEAHAEVVDAPESVCKFGEHHSGETARAEICQPCYERLQERVDVLEATLHLELKEAAQIIYDAVWADPSDPSKTYQNAASALLTELRKRAGMTTVLGPFQPMAH